MEEKRRKKEMTEHALFSSTVGVKKESFKNYLEEDST
jgi:hypothetical protein